MSIKKEYLIPAGIIVVLLGYLIFRQNDQVHYKIPELEPVKKESIDKVEITRGDKTLRLVKKEMQWTIDPQGYPTNMEKVDPMLNTISNLKLTDLAARSGAYAKYDLDKENGVQVKAYAKDKTIREFVVGKMAQTYGHTFVKIKDDDNVYYARESFRSQFDLKMDELRNKSALNIDPNEITEVTYQNDNQTFVFTKKVKPGSSMTPIPSQTSTPTASPDSKPAPQDDNFTWETPGGQKVVKSQVDAIIAELKEFNCDEYIEGKTKEDLNADTPICTVKLKERKDYTLSIFKKAESPTGAKPTEGEAQEEKYPAFSSENPYPFYLNSWRVNQIMKKPEDLIEKEEKKAEPAKAKTELPKAGTKKK